MQVLHQIARGPTHVAGGHCEVKGNESSPFINIVEILLFNYIHIFFNKIIVLLVFRA